MTRPFPILLLLIAILAVACTNEPATPTTTPDTTTTTSLQAPTTTTADDLSPELVVSTGDGIRILDADGLEVTSRQAPEGATYRQPVFTSDGSILVAETDASGSSALIRLSSEDDLAEVSRTEMSSPPFYYHPNAAGPFRSTSLRNDPNGGGLVIEEVDDAGELTPISRVAPYYSSWDPEGDRVATHVGTERLEIRSSDGSTEVVIDGTGSFQAPMWTDSGVITLRTVDGEQLLSRWTDGGIVDLASAPGPIQFVARGDLIALQSLASPAGGVQTSLRTQAGVELPPGRLVVFDAASGDVVTVTSGVAIYFEWDVAGERLLYATIQDAGTATLQWFVWSDGSSTGYGTFAANPVWVRDTVPFFDQYVQSAPLWSSDGTAFAYPTVQDGLPIVVIQPLSGEPITVDDAVWATWDR